MKTRIDAVAQAGHDEVVILDGRYLTMRRFNAYDFYSLGTRLKELERLQGGTSLRQWIFPLAMGRISMQELMEGQPLPIKVTLQAAREVVTSLANLLRSEAINNPQAQIDPFQVSTLQSALGTFNTVFNAELANLDTYWVEPKGIYSTSELIEHAENIFSESVRSQLANETRVDVNQSGRCIAFDLPTAASFHVWRAVERELRVYYQIWTGQEAGRKVWDTLLKELQGTQANAKVVAVLDHLRHLHRNPTMHPEAYLTMDEAVSLFGIAQSAIAAMVNDKPASQPAPDSNSP